MLMLGGMVDYPVALTQAGYPRWRRVVQLRELGGRAGGYAGVPEGHGRHTGRYCVKFGNHLRL